MTELNWPAIHKWHSDRKSACQCRRHGFDPWVGKISWRKKWKPTPVFLLGKVHGQRSLVDRLLWMGSQRVGHNWAYTHTHTQHILNTISHKKRLRKVLLNTFKSKWQETRGEIPKLRPLFISNCWHFWTSESWQSHLLGSIRETSLCLPQNLPLTNNAYTKF